MRLVRILRIFAEDTCRFRALQEEFEKGTPDEDWIPVVATWTPKPVILGGDGRILKNPAQLLAIQAAQTHFVYLVESFVNLPWQEQILKVLKVWGQLCEVLSAAREPTVFLIKAKQPKVEAFKKLADIPCQKIRKKLQKRAGRNLSA